MSHKLEYDCICYTCKQPKTFDEIYDGETGICEACHEEWFAKEYARLKPIYDAEKRAGLLDKDD
jgi:hypothetical protein